MFVSNEFVLDELLLLVPHEQNLLLADSLKYVELVLFINNAFFMEHVLHEFPFISPPLTLRDINKLLLLLLLLPGIRLDEEFVWPKCRCAKCGDC